MKDNPCARHYPNGHHNFWGIENPFENLFNSVREIIISVDLEGRILTWNASAERTLGYSYEEVKGHALFDYLDGNQVEVLRDIISHATGTNEPVMGECELQKAQKECLIISWVCSPLKDPHAQITGMVIVGRDITEHRRLKKQISQSQKLAALGTMADGIAHEIRNPLTICSSAAQFLLDTDLQSDFIKECAEKIQKSVIRTSKIIDALLNFSRPSVKAHIESVDIHDLMLETLTWIIKQAETQQIIIIKEFHQESLFIPCNRSLMQHVFVSIFQNSLKAMPNGGILTIATDLTDTEVQAKISDTGHGIPRDAITRIFDPFYTFWPDGQGTGLSLSLCYAIVQENGGHIEADSIEGRGTTFTIHFPLVV